MTTANTQPTDNQRIDRLYDRLRSFGLKESYVRETVLPSWWDDEYSADWGAYTEALMLVSRHLGFSIESLRSDGDLASEQVDAQYKIRGGTDESELTLSTTVARRAASLAVLGLENHFAEEISAKSIRDTILGVGNDWVDFKNLLEFCWNIGLPVLFIDKDKLPQGKCMEGMAAKVGKQPVIVLCKKEKLQSWMLFILAHEIAHVMLGHVRDEGVIVDEFFGTNSEREELELEADRFALELLTGDPSYSSPLMYRRTSARKLADYSTQVGAIERVCPGHIALNYGYKTNSFGVAIAAAKLLENNKRARDVANEALNSNLDWSSIPTDSAEFLSRLIGAEYDTGC